MSLVDSINAAVTALTAQNTAIESERAAILAASPTEASPSDILVHTSHTEYVSPAGLWAALTSSTYLTAVGLGSGGGGGGGGITGLTYNPFIITTVGAACWIWSATYTDVIAVGTTHDSTWINANMYEGSISDARAPFASGSWVCQQYVVLTGGYSGAGAASMYLFVKIA